MMNPPGESGHQHASAPRGASQGQCEDVQQRAVRPGWARGGKL